MNKFSCTALALAAVFTITSVSQAAEQGSLKSVAVAAKPTPWNKVPTSKKMSVHLLRTYELINRKYYKQILSKTAHARCEKDKLTVSVPGEGSWSYLIGELLGRGTTGSVWHATDEHSGKTQFAIKAVQHDTEVKFHSAKDLRAEAENLLRWQGQRRHIVGCVGFFFSDKAVTKSAKPTDLHAFLIMPYTGEELYRVHRQRLDDRKPFEAEEISAISAQIADGLDYLHTVCRHVHTDLKPENVTLKVRNSAETESGTEKTPRYLVTIIDLTSAHSLEKCPADRIIGSRYYRSLEVLLHMGWGAPADIYALGCMIFELIGGYPPFEGACEAWQISRVAAVTGLPKQKLYAYHNPDKDSNPPDDWQIRISDREEPENDGLELHTCDYQDTQSFQTIAKNLMAKLQGKRPAAEPFAAIINLVARMIHADADARPPAAEVLKELI